MIDDLYCDESVDSLDSLGFLESSPMSSDSAPSPPIPIPNHFQFGSKRPFNAPPLRLTFSPYNKQQQQQREDPITSLIDWSPPPSKSAFDQCVDIIRILQVQQEKERRTLLNTSGMFQPVKLPLPQIDYELAYFNRFFQSTSPHATSHNKIWTEFLNADGMSAAFDRFMAILPYYYDQEQWNLFGHTHIHGVYGTASTLAAIGDFFSQATPRLSKGLLSNPVFWANSRDSYQADREASIARTLRDDVELPTLLTPDLRAVMICEVMSHLVLHEPEDYPHQHTASSFLRGINYADQYMSKFPSSDGHWYGRLLTACILLGGKFENDHASATPHMLTRVKAFDPEHDFDFEEVMVVEREVMTSADAVWLTAPTAFTYLHEILQLFPTTDKAGDFNRLTLESWAESLLILAAPMEAFVGCQSDLMAYAVCEVLMEIPPSKFLNGDDRELIDRYTTAATVFLEQLRQLPGYRKVNFHRIASYKQMLMSSAQIWDPVHEEALRLLLHGQMLSPFIVSLWFPEVVSPVIQKADGGGQILVHLPDGDYRFIPLTAAHLQRQSIIVPPSL